MKFRRSYAAASLAVVLSAAGGLRAAPLKVNHHLRSTPGNLVQGYFSAETFNQRLIERMKK